MSSRPAGLGVYLHSQRVGHIRDLGGSSIFVFDNAYVADPARRTLGSGFLSRSGAIAYEPRPHARQVDPFFSNMLPEGLLRQYVERRHDVANEFDLLVELGGDLPGAAVLVPERDIGEPMPLSELADGRDAARDGGPALRLKFSLAGVQMKLSAIRQGGRISVPASGIGGDWIVKLPSPQHHGAAENEYWMMELARRSGFDVPEIALVDIEALEGIPSAMMTATGKAFMVKRFDRSGTGRVHVEDFAQIFRLYPTHENKYRRANYELIGAFFASAGLSEAKDYLARLVFMVAIGNGDMHIKNWSVIYRDGITPTLAPAYDWLSTVPYIQNESLALKLGEQREFRAITQEVLADFGRRLGMRKSLAASVVNGATFAYRGRLESLTR